MSGDQELEVDSVTYEISSDSEADIEGDGGLSAKEAERLRIHAEVEAFLAEGGEITTVDTNVMTDPPKRPESNYGGQPI
ncbi:MAG: hypothetical protein K6L76_11950 [Agarilytica sp.]